MNALHAFLRTLTVVDGRSGDEIRKIVGCSRATLKRRLAEARQLGCEIRHDIADGRYRVVDAGPFDLGRLRRTRLYCGWRAA